MGVFVTMTTYALTEGHAMKRKKVLQPLRQACSALLPAARLMP